MILIFFVIGGPGGAHGQLFLHPLGSDSRSWNTSVYTTPSGTSYTGWYVPDAGGFLAPGYFAEFGQQHTGEDWNGRGGGDTDLGQPVYAASSGRVVFAGDAGCGWGNMVVLEHPPFAYFPGPSFVLPDGRTVTEAWTVYAHLRDVAVVADQYVDTRDELGTVGRRYKCKRNASGQVVSREYVGSAHLHFEVRVPGPDAPATWPLPAWYWPSGAGKDAAWIRDQYTTPSAFLALNEVCEPALPPPVPYEIEGLCPGECCFYGRWTAVQPTMLHASPMKQASVVSTIAPGEQFDANTGVIRTTRYGASIVYGEHSRLCDTISALPGDCVALLTYLGEGFYEVWKEGARIGQCELNLVDMEPQVEWWVAAQRDTGEQGWFLYEGRFIGSHPCYD